MADVLTRAAETVFETADHDVTHVATARSAIAAWLDRHDASDDLRDAVLLLTSELVTNAVRNTNGLVRVTVGLVLGGIKVQVFDEGLDPPARRVAADDATSGRGLAIVEAIADRWGTHQSIGDDHVGKVVWATCGRR